MHVDDGKLAEFITSSLSVLLIQCVQKLFLCNILKGHSSFSQYAAILFLTGRMPKLCNHIIMVYNLSPLYRETVPFLQDEIILPGQSYIINCDQHSEGFLDQVRVAMVDYASSIIGYAF